MRKCGKQTLTSVLTNHWLLWLSAVHSYTSCQLWQPLHPSLCSRTYTCTSHKSTCPNQLIWTSQYLSFSNAVDITDDDDGDDDDDDDDDDDNVAANDDGPTTTAAAATGDNDDDDEPYPPSCDSTILFLLYTMSLKANILRLILNNGIYRWKILSQNNALTVMKEIRVTLNLLLLPYTRANLLFKVNNRQIIMDAAIHKLGLSRP